MCIRDSFQIARCYRDEDFRADRQPEFTQLDIEMSFVEQDDILELGEALASAIWQVIGVDLPMPLPRMTYAEAVSYTHLDVDKRQVLRGGELHDTISRRPVLGSRLSLDGMVFDVRVDTVDFGAAGTLDREYVEHPGAALIVALHPIDGVDHVCLIRQYRHPVGCYLWELPAGLLAVSAEPPWEAGRRELAEDCLLYTSRRPRGSMRAHHRRGPR